MVNPGFFSDPQWPVILADELAGISPIEAHDPKGGETNSSEETKASEIIADEKPPIRKSDRKFTLPTAEQVQNFFFSAIAIVVLLIIGFVLIVFVGGIIALHTTKIPKTDISLWKAGKIIYGIFFGGSN